MRQLVLMLSVKGRQIQDLETERKAFFERVFGDVFGQTKGFDDKSRDKNEVKDEGIIFKFFWLMEILLAVIFAYCCHVYYICDNNIINSA